jgi:hypothetical protein
MTPTFNQYLRVQRPSGCEEIRVSKWTEDSNVCISFGDLDHQTVIYLEPHMADRLGWALLKANSRHVDMPLDGEPARD